MNAYMNITVRVVSAQALAQLKALEAQQNRVAASSAAVGRTANKPWAIGPMIRFGSQLQWIGRQLQYNFTLPIALAAGAATKFALDNEKAFVRMKKVYGDLSMSTEQMTNETNALRKAFVELSNFFGVAQKDVISIAADWAAAGSSGVALAKSVELTLKTMVLGEMDAAEATRALISIQAQYRFSSDQMIDTINQLNVIENQTGISLQGLIQGFERAAGVAKNAGIDVSHLGAMLAAITPAAGTAAQAGNSLKTIISRLMAPTKAVVEVLGQLGIVTSDMNWKSLTATQRLELLAKSWKNLSQSQKIVLATTLGSRFQINRLSTLLDEIGSKTGFYAKALDATSNKEKYFAQATKELNMVLDSNPQKLKQIWVMIQNGMAEAIGPMIPYILMAAETIKRMVLAFQGWPPELQKTIALLLIFLALMGPILRYVGMISIVVGFLKPMFVGLAGAIVGFGKGVLGFFGAIATGITKIGPLIATAVTGPWGIAFAAVIGAAIIFHNQLAKIWTSIVNFTINAFNALPQGIQNAMMAVINIVYKAVQAVVELFSYLNPFARHSPSLVDNVTKGMAEVSRQFATITKIKGPIAQAYADIKKFSQAMAEFRRGMDTIHRAEDLSKILKVAPGAADEFKALVADLKQLTAILNSLQAAIDRQQKVVDLWEQKLEAANNELDKQQAKLERLQKVADGYSKSLDEANSRLTYFANAPIQGMRAMSDAIFENEQAQKALRLEILKMGDIKSVDELRNQLAMLQGEIEGVRAEQTDLRDLGAGSDITGFYDQQVAGLQEQQRAINESLKPVQNLEDQLAELERQGEILNLEQSLQFDPLLRQIDQLANGMEELPFDTIMAGITQAKLDVDKYTIALENANKAVERQQVVVDEATAARDRISRRLDQEQAQLDKLKEKYDLVNQAIQDINQSLSDMVSLADEKIQRLADAAAARKAARDAAAAKKKADAAKAGAKTAKLGTDAANFQAAAGGNFPVPGGTSKIGREGIAGDQSKLIDDYTQALAQRTSQMLDSFDIFGPLRKKWTEFTEWAKGVWTSFDTWWSGVKFDIDTSGLGKTVDFIGSVFSTISGWAQAFWRLIDQDVIQIWDELGNKVEKAWNTIGPEIQKFSELLAPLGRLFQLLWPYVKLVAMVVGGVLLAAFKIFAAVLGNTVGPALDFIIDVIADVIRVIRGLVEFVLGILTGDWSLAWRGIQDIVGGVFEGIYHIIEGAASIIWGLVSGLVEGVVDWFGWLYDELIGKSIPEIVDSVVQFWKDLPGRIWDALKDLVSNIYQAFMNVWDMLIGHSVIPEMMDAIVGYFLGLPGRIWDALTELAGKIVSRFVDVALAIGDWMVETTGDILGWFRDLPGKIWDALSGLVSKVISRFVDVWNAWVEWRNDFYSKVWKWFSDLPQNIWTALVNLAGKVKDRFVGMGNTIHDWLMGGGGWIANLAGWMASIPGKLFDALSNLAGRVLDRFQGMGSAIRGWLLGDDGWIAKLVSWFADIPHKIWNGIREGANWMLERFAALFNKIGQAAVNGVNLAISAVNGLINALNWVADHVPVLDFNIPKISRIEYNPIGAPQLAAGGVIPKTVGSGFATNQARAIVGEGGLHPEFVIPTDPKYRKNALSLMDQAKKTMGLKNAGGPWDFIKGVVTNLREGAIDLMFAPIKAAFNAAISHVPEFMGIRAIAQAFFEKIKDWMSGVESNVSGPWQKPVNLAPGLKYGNTYSDGSFHSGQDFPGPIGYPVKAAGSGKLAASYDIPGTSPYNNYPYASYGRLVQIAHNEGISTLYAHLSERIATKIGSEISAGDIIGKLGTMGNSTGPHLHFEVRQNGHPIDPMAFLRSKGVKFDTGGFLKTGESTVTNNTGTPERVLSSSQWSIIDRATRVSMVVAAGLPDAIKSAATVAVDRAVTIAGGRAAAADTRSSQTITSGGGDVTINIYGDLSFPNIESGSDAREFINNLKALAAS